MTTDVFVALRQRLPALSKVERRIADFVLGDPDVVVSSTITELAALCDTSQASVARFCQAVGYGGYRDFRIALASASSREQAALEHFRVADADIAPGDSAFDVVSKVAYQEARAIEETARGLDLLALDAVVKAISGASRIDIIGAGASGLTGQDLHQKLHRFGLTTYFWVDAHLALTSVALSSPESVAVGISHSGLTVETYQALEIAKAAGATTVAITNFPESPIAELADHVLTTSARETRLRSGAMSSRIAQMALVDFLVVRLLQGHIDEANVSLRRTYNAVQHHRLDFEHHLPTRTDTTE